MDRVNRNCAIIAVGCGLGARDHGCAHGPEVLRDMGLLERLAIIAPSLIWQDVAVDEGGGITPALSVATTCRNLADVVAETLRRGLFPIIIGGDHSIAMGTWSGLRRTMAPEQGFQLLWIDAHMDCHVPATSPSGALHGMPLACLLGRCHPDLAGIPCPVPPLRPDQIVLAGVRSFEPEEEDFTHHAGIRVIAMAEIRAKGLSLLLAPPDRPFGITLDLDALDPEDAPGVGSPVPGGLRAEELLAALERLLSSPHCLALEIVEFSPPHDVGGKTAALIETILGMALQPGQ